MNDSKKQPQSSGYKKGSLTLWGAVSMGTGVMIGAGIFALTGQLAELAGELFPLAFLAAAVVCSFSAYNYLGVIGRIVSCFFRRAAISAASTFQGFLDSVTVFKGVTN